MSVTLYQGAATSISQGGISLVAVYGPTIGGLVTNPLAGSDQNLANAEPLYISLVGSASLAANATTTELLPGQSFTIPPNCTSNVWVNAVSTGHRFSAITFQSSTQSPTIFAGTFPPSGPTGLLDTIPSYIFQEYADDDSLQAFASSYNELTQEYIDWFNNVNLPVYTQLEGVGGSTPPNLLDWVAEGLYGFPRPVLYSAATNLLGPLNTCTPNQLQVAINGLLYVTSVSNVGLASDDIYQRCLTWHFYKGDGKYFCTRWLKRRIIRFLYGTNGADSELPSYSISIQYSPLSQVAYITIISGFTNITGGAFLNGICPGGLLAGPPTPQLYTTPNGYYGIIQTQSVPALSGTFKQAIDDGILEFPFQFTPSVTIGNIGAIGGLA